jgi:hypothetical protein
MLQVCSSVHCRALAIKRQIVLPKVVLPLLVSATTPEWQAHLANGHNHCPLWFSRYLTLDLTSLWSCKPRIRELYVSRCQLDQSASQPNFFLFPLQHGVSTNVCADISAPQVAAPLHARHAQTACAQPRRCRALKGCALRRAAQRLAVAGLGQAHRNAASASADSTCAVDLQPASQTRCSAAKGSGERCSYSTDADQTQGAKCSLLH